MSATPTRPKGFAFFDFDNTLIHGDSGPLFGSYLMRDRYERIRKEQGEKAARKDQRRVLLKYVPYATWMSVAAGLYKTRALRRSQLIRAAYRGLKGVPAEQYYGLMDDFVRDELVDRIYPEMKRVVAGHVAAGRTCVIITTGIQALVEAAAKHLGSPVTIIGCTLDEKDGRLTGKVDGPLYGADKANILRAYAHGAKVDLADCWSYTDHFSDYHMLEAVGHGVCVNPRGRLVHMAEQKGWEVLTPPAPEDP